MKAVFIESSQLTRWGREFLTDEALSTLQRDLTHEPEIGAVMPGCGGSRQYRIADSSRGKGKRGARAIYPWPARCRSDLPRVTRRRATRW